MVKKRGEQKGNLCIGAAAACWIFSHSVQPLQEQGSVQSDLGVRHILGSGPPECDIP